MLSVISGVLKANIFDSITLVDSSDTTEYGFSIVRCSMVLSVSMYPVEVCTDAAVVVVVVPVVRGNTLLPLLFILCCCCW